MRIRDAQDKLVKAVFEFGHRHAIVSVTTLTQFPEVAVFLTDEVPGEPRAFGPFSGIPEAIQFIDHLHFTKIASGA